MISTAHKDKYGNIEWRNADGQRHRENGPAVEWNGGSKEWYRNGQRHRENGPAIEKTDGYKAWFINDQSHRENGPAIEEPDGSKEWYRNGLLHRENGPAVELADGNLRVFLAAAVGGYESYYLHGKSGPEVVEKVKENMARIQAEKNRQKIFDKLSQDDNISNKINTCSPKTSKKL